MRAETLAELKEQLKEKNYDLSNRIYVLSIIDVVEIFSHILEKEEIDLVQVPIDVLDNVLQNIKTNTDGIDNKAIEEVEGFTYEALAKYNLYNTEIIDPEGQTGE